MEIYIGLQYLCPSQDYNIHFVYGWRIGQQAYLTEYEVLCWNETLIYIHTVLRYLILILSFNYKQPSILPFFLKIMMYIFYFQRRHCQRHTCCGEVQFLVPQDLLQSQVFLRPFSVQGSSRAASKTRGARLDFEIKLVIAFKYSKISEFQSSVSPIISIYISMLVNINKSNKQKF